MKWPIPFVNLVIIAADREAAAASGPAKDSKEGKPGGAPQAGREAGREAEKPRAVFGGGGGWYDYCMTKTTDAATPPLKPHAPVTAQGAGPQPDRPPRASDAPQPDALMLALAEVRDLQRTVVVLRSELEKVHQERQRQVQDAVAAASTEAQQVRATVVAMRETLEQATVARDAAVKAALAGSVAEITQLRDTVTVLRSELERLNTEHANARQQAATAYRTEVMQLHDTVRALRSALEAQAVQAVRPAAA